MIFMIFVRGIPLISFFWSYSEQPRYIVLNKLPKKSVCGLEKAERDEEVYDLSSQSAY